MKEVFEAALDHAPEERSVFVGQVCAGDELLHREVESLLSSYEQEKSFLETPAPALVAQSLIKEERAALVGQQLGRFQIVREIGRGGMGVVYLAQDISLGRPVALKLLPKHLTGDPNRLRRFEREARAASALNHHNILTIYEIAKLDGLHSIVTEFVDGVTLRERIKSKELQLSEALTIAEQIASALVAAHDAGIVHRDIKPENVMLRRDGYIKVLDFGLVKLTEQEVVEVGTSSAGIAEITDTGVMGTVGYMSPEQAQGLSVDKRTDIFSLGVVIYEMVTGQMPFTVKTSGSDIVPDPGKEALPIAHYLPKAPDELQLIVTSALCLDREKRYQTMADLLEDLKAVRLKATRKNRFTARRIGLLAATFVLMLAGSLWFYSSRGTDVPSLPAMKVLPFTSYQGEEYLPSFSPDGNQIAFGWNGERDDKSDSSIYVKQIGFEKPVRLTFDTAFNDNCPVWSPDGQMIAFNRFSKAEVSIFIVPAAGGSERKILTLGPNLAWPTLPTLAWSPDGNFIAFTYRDPRDAPAKIFLVSPATLEKRTLTSPVAGSLGDYNPAFSPDGQSVAFLRLLPESADIYTVFVSGGEPQRLTFDKTFFWGLTWSADGHHIIYASQHSGVYSLWRIPFSGGAAERVVLDGSNFFFPNISRNRNRLAFMQTPVEDANIHSVEVSDATLSKNTPTKLIASTRSDGAPQFSPDGKRIAFHSDRSGPLEIWICDRDGKNLMKLTDLTKKAGSPRWSPDGQQIVFDLYDGSKGDIYAVNVEGGPPHPIVTDASDDHWPSWSADGKWIYFSSDRSGTPQVWKVPAQGGAVVQVTKQGGYFPFESRDGKYVYYVRGSLAPGLWRVSTDTGEEVRFLDSFGSELGAVVNDGIYYIDEHAKDGAALEFLDFATHKKRLISKLGQMTMLPFAVAVSPDRRQILYTQNDQTGADIMLVENFR